MEMLGITSFLSRQTSEHTVMISPEISSILNAESLLKSNDLDKLSMLYQSIDEYNTFDFSAAKIHLENWTTERIVNIPFPQWSAAEWEKKIRQSTMTSFLEWDNLLPFDTQEKRIGYWKKYGTWEIPIVLIQMSDFGDSNTSKPVQLFEGHNRLFRLKVLYKYKSIELQKHHMVFVIKNSKITGR